MTNWLPSIISKRVDWLAYGFTEILTAQDADQARQILADGHIDLVLSDIEMRVKVVWPWLNQSIRIIRIPKASSSPAMLISTASKKAMKAKVLDYVLKPIDYTELKTLLAQFAEQRKT